MHRLMCMLATFATATLQVCMPTQPRLIVGEEEVTLDRDPFRREPKGLIHPVQTVTVSSAPLNSFGFPGTHLHAQAAELSTVPLQGASTWHTGVFCAEI